MELQSALLLMGIVIIGAVALGAYDTLRIRSRMAQTKSGQKQSPPPASARSTARGLDVNPGLPTATDQKILSTDAPPGTVKQSDEAEFYQALADFEHVAVMPLSLNIDAPNSQEPAQSMPDPRLDFIIHLPGQGPVARDQALAVYKQNEYLLDKPREIYGLRYNSGLWTNLAHDTDTARYSDIAVAIQLLDTQGPITESELNTFSQLGLKLADAFQRPTKLAQTFEQALEHAADLNQFCETYDVFASINLVPLGNEGFKGRLVEHAAVRAGMEFGAMNIFHMKNMLSSGSQHLFSLANMFNPGNFNLQRIDNTIYQGLTLFMSLPAVHQPVQVFGKMMGTATQLCEFLGAKMLDHDRRPLTPHGLQVIATQIERLNAEMQAYGVVPGSPSALRLFFHNHE